MYKIPLADGGEGTMGALVTALGGTVYPLRVTGPLGRPVNAAYTISADKKIGIVELSSASGLQLVAEEYRNPLVTTTFGTSKLIKSSDKPWHRKTNYCYGWISNE